MKITLHIKLTIIILLTSIIFFGTYPIDTMVSDKFYNPTTQSWILDKNLQPYRFIFYDGIKKLLIIIAIVFLALRILLRNSPMITAYKKGMVVVILSAIFIPAIVGGLKKVTNMPCPKNELHYGGAYPSIKIWEPYPKNFKQCNKICCFPAGHASGGFALLSLFFLFKSRRNKVLAIIGSLSVGWSMGIYKMLIGDHFLSHTVITMILAWLIILIIQTIIDKPSKKDAKIHSK